MDRFKLNIIGCIEQYQDFQTAIKWLEGGKLELSENDFIELVQSIQEHFLQTHQFNNAEKFLNLEVIPVTTSEIFQNIYNIELRRDKEMLATNELNKLLEKYQFEDAEIYFSKNRDSINQLMFENLLKGAKAKELHLIDEIGGIQEVEKYLSDKIGEKAEVCWY